MSTNTVHRYADAPTLARGAAKRLVAALEDLQAEPGRVAQLCLTGGRIAARMYKELGRLIQDSGVDTRRLELWWGDERFVPTSDPDRNAGPTLALLARHFSLDPARTHPMPAADGIIDSAECAAAYEKELGDTVFDICLLGMGPDGHVASIFPGHPSFAERSYGAIGVTNSPKPPPERISLTIPTLNRSRQIWFLVSGEDKAEAVARSWNGDRSIPAGVVRGTVETTWLVDSDASSRIPYHSCSL
jgi:6-phosphogluconolactonase